MVEQNAEWKTRVESFREFRSREMTHGPKFSECWQDLQDAADKSEEQGVAMDRCVRSLEDWRTNLREGSTRRMEQKMRSIMTLMMDGLSELSPSARTKTLAQVKLVLSCFPGSPEDLVLAQRVEGMSRQAAASERTCAWDEALGQQPAALVKALVGLRGSALPPSSCE